MNILRNFEAVFVVALGLACATSYTLDRTTDTAPAPALAAASNMQVVVVSAKRLTAEQKQAALQSVPASALATRNASASNM